MSLVCNKVEIRVVDSLRSGFVLKTSIAKILQKKNYNLIGKNFSEIDLLMLKNDIMDYPPVQNALVYKTIDGRIVIEVKQRCPILRIMDNNNESYYIDENGFIMQLSGNYTSQVLIANGYISTKFPINNKTNVLDIESKTQGNRVVQADLYKLAKYVNNNKFWNAQIQQIFVNFSGDFELIPVVGANVINFGDYSDCETKFNNLLSLYKHGLPVVGWNKYEYINLKFKGQIICTKRE
jgi:cell division protein FtsQ